MEDADVSESVAHWILSLDCRCWIGVSVVLLDVDEDDVVEL